MNTSQLECFISLAHTLSFMKTAQQLYLTQPAVSKQIQSLEQELGARLFTRTTRSVTLTEIGKQFLPDANTILTTFYHSKDWISSFNQHFYQSFKIGYSDPNCLNLITKCLIPLLQNLELTPDLNLDQTDVNLQKLINGQLDLVIGIRDAHFKDDSISFHKLREEHFIVALPADHPLSGHTEALTSAMLHNYRQVIAIPPYLLTSNYSRGRTLLPVNDQLSNIICTTVNEAIALIKTGELFAFVPEYLAVEDVDIIYLPWQESPHAPLGVYYRKDIKDDSQHIVHQFLGIIEETI